MQRRKRRRSDRAGRPAMRSPGRPPATGRTEQQRFWKAIARGLSSEDAAVSCGVSPPVGGRWFRDMNKSGWWMWIGIIPLLWPVILLVLFCRASNTRSNRYGPTPDLVAVRGIRSA